MPNICSIHHYPHRHMSSLMHKTTSMLAKHAGPFVWMGCLEPIIISQKNVLDSVPDGLFKTNTYPHGKIIIIIIRRKVIIIIMIISFGSGNE